MDSPKPTTATTVTAATFTSTSAPTSSGSPPVQESPFSNFLSKLSPIEVVKAPHTLPGFLGINSPPLVFTSPSINTAATKTNFEKRLEHLPPSIGNTPQHDNDTEKVSGDVEKSVNTPHDDARETDQDQVQRSSSSGCLDEYLADPVDADSENSAYPSCAHVEQSNKTPQSSPNGSTCLKKLILESDNKANSWMKISAPLNLSGEAQEHYQQKSAVSVKSMRNEGEEPRSGNWPSTECLDTEADLQMDHAPTNQQYSCFDTEIAVAGQQEDYNCSQHLYESQQIIRPYDHSGSDIQEISHGPIAERTHDQAGQNQRGASRRCLQFEEFQSRTLVKRKSPLNLANYGNADSDGNADLSTPAKNKEINLSQYLTPVILPCHSGKSSIPVSKPLGIGLHLNSIVNTISVGHCETPNGKPAKDSLTDANNMHCTRLSYSDGKVSIFAEDAISKMKLIIPANSASESLQIEEDETPWSNTVFDSKNANNSEDLDENSHNKKRNRTSDGCKRCNCKKTKCLKLYCDCFAAGVYCAESCACRGCFNKPEHEDTVLETKRRIESRNPMAFVPKEQEDHFTPSSARHKRGCNCKKSMCLKKYCECYQSNVGCSDGCRCEGCQNVYGKKEDFMMTGEMVGQGTIDERMELGATKNLLLQAETYEPHNLTPVTPALCSDHGKDASKSQYIPKRCLPSPESDLAMLSSVKFPRSLRNADNNEIVETNKEMPDRSPYSQLMDNDNLDTEQLLPRFDAPSNTQHSTSAPNPPPTTGCSVSSKAKSRKSSLIQLGPGSCRLSAGGSLRWRSSPVTPVTRSCLGGTKNLEGLEPDSGLCDIPEDVTTEKLEDASTPIKPVKVNSPNRKRVSLPLDQVHERGSSSSAALKSGRRFILRAVAFPPLTPLIDSKGSSCEASSELPE